MTLNLKGLKNEMSYSLIITNLDNSVEETNCRPNINTSRDMWLGAAERGINIDIFYNEGIRKRLLYIYDFNWAIRYYQADRDGPNPIEVDGNKDFWLRLKDDEAIFECEGGSFKPGHEKVHLHGWRSWLEYDYKNGKIDLLDVWGEGRIEYKASGSLVVAGFPQSDDLIYNLNKWDKRVGTGDQLIPKLLPVETWDNPVFPIRDSSVRFITSMNSPIIDKLLRKCIEY